ncbi:hypothetical protein [Tateyamaria sp.]
MGVSTKTVQRAIVVLEEEGLLLRKERYHCSALGLLRHS